MKKTLAIMLALATMLIILCPAALASSYIYITGNCNVRTGPGKGYDIIGSVLPGSTLDSMGDTSCDSRGVAWYAVQFGGRKGWVSSAYANPTDISGEAFYSDGAYGNFGGGAYQGTTYVYGTWAYATGKCNVRTGPGINFASMGVLQKGEQAPFQGTSSVDGRGVAWYSINFNGTTGWVSSVYCSVY